VDFTVRITTDDAFLVSELDLWMGQYDWLLQEIGGVSPG
jgi:hypothetical protein